MLNCWRFHCDLMNVNNADKLFCWNCRESKLLNVTEILKTKFSLKKVIICSNVDLIMSIAIVLITLIIVLRTVFSLKMFELKKNFEIKFVSHFFFCAFIKYDFSNELLNCDFENTIFDFVVCFWCELVYDFEPFVLSHKSMNFWNIVREEIDHDIVFSHQLFRNSLSHLLISFCIRVFLICYHLFCDDVFFFWSLKINREYYVDWIRNLFIFFIQMWRLFLEFIW